MTKQQYEQYEQYELNEADIDKAYLEVHNRLKKATGGRGLNITDASFPVNLSDWSNAEADFKSIYANAMSMVSAAARRISAKIKEALRGLVALDLMS